MSGAVLPLVTSLTSSYLLWSGELSVSGVSRLVVSVSVLLTLQWSVVGAAVSVLVSSLLAHVDQCHQAQASLIYHHHHVSQHKQHQVWLVVIVPALKAVYRFCFCLFQIKVFSGTSYISDQLHHQSVF